MQKEFQNIAVNDTGEVVNFIAELTANSHIFAFTGDVGAGKTTLIKRLVKALGSSDAVSSPTFSLVNEYLCDNGRTIYHSDWYRINDIYELFDAGILEYLEIKDAIIFIEWPEIGTDILKDYSVTKMRITHKNNVRDYLIEY